jgi:hypothetical protein
MTSVTDTQHATADSGGATVEVSPGAADAFKELVKGTISLPLEGCKSMATGCATVAGIYGAITAFVNSGRSPSWEQWEIYAILAPFVLWAFAGFRFGAAYLPSVRMSDLLSNAGNQPDAKFQWNQLLERESFLRASIVTGSKFFWAAFIWAVVCIALVRNPE